MKTVIRTVKFAAFAALLGTGTLMAQTGQNGPMRNPPPPPPPGPRPAISGTQAPGGPGISGTQAPRPPVISGTQAPGGPAISGSSQPKGLPLGPRGLRMGLEVAGFKIMLPPDSLLVNGTFTGKRPPAVPVSATLTNEARADLAVGFDSPQAADRKIDFRLYDANGELVWSPAANDTPAETEIVLNAHRSWKARAGIPLLINGSYLPAGAYTVEAAAGAAPLASTRIAIEIVPNDGTTPPEPPQPPQPQ